MSLKSIALYLDDVEYVLLAAWLLKNLRDVQVEPFMLDQLNLLTASKGRYLIILLGCLFEKSVHLETFFVHFSLKRSTSCTSRNYIEIPVLIIL